MLCLNKRQCHSVILFSVLHIYTGDTEQRQLRYEARGGYTHAKFDLAEELNPEIYATVHASSSVLSAVEKPR